MRGCSACQSLARSALDDTVRLRTAWRPAADEPCRPNHGRGVHSAVISAWPRMDLLRRAPDCKLHTGRPWSTVPCSESLPYRPNARFVGGLGGLQGRSTEPSPGGIRRGMDSPRSRRSKRASSSLETATSQGSGCWREPEVAVLRHGVDGVPITTTRSPQLRILKVSNCPSRSARSAAAHKPHYRAGRMSGRLLVMSSPGRYAPLTVCAYAVATFTPMRDDALLGRTTGVFQRQSRRALAFLEPVELDAGLQPDRGLAQLGEAVMRTRLRHPHARSPDRGVPQLSETRIHGEGCDPDHPESSPAA